MTIKTKTIAKIIEKYQEHLYEYGATSPQWSFNENEYGPGFCTSFYYDEDHDDDDLSLNLAIAEMPYTSYFFLTTIVSNIFLIPLTLICTSHDIFSDQKDMWGEYENNCDNLDIICEGLSGTFQAIVNIIYFPPYLLTLILTSLCHILTRLVRTTLEIIDDCCQMLPTFS